MASPHTQLVHALVISIGLTFAAARASEFGRPFVQTYTPRDYEADNQVWCAEQGPDGVMFFGNERRVLTFDGVHWSRVAVRARNVRGLAPAPDGRIYVGGTDAVGYLARNSSGNWEYTSLLPSLPEEMRATGTARGVFLHQGAVYFLSSENLFRWRDGRFHVWKLGEPAWQWDDQLDGEAYIFRRGRGLLRVKGDDLELVSAAPEVVASTRMILFRLPDGGLGGVLGNGQLVRISHDHVETVPTEADSLLKSGLYMGRRLRDGTLVLATPHSGIVHLAPNGRILGFVDTSLGLENQSVLNVGEDREGNVWLCTNAGVARVEFGRAYTLFDRHNGLGRDEVTTMARFGGQLWAGAWDGLYVLEPGNGATPARFKRKEGINGAVWSTVAIRDQLLIGTSTGVASVWADGTVHPVVQSTLDALCLTPSVRDPSLVYVGGAIGFSRLQWLNGAWRNLGRVPGVDDTNVRSIAEGPDGDLWLGTRDHGFYHVHWTGADRVPQIEKYLSRAGLPPDQGYSSVFRLHGETYFCTDVLLYRFNAGQQRFEPQLGWQIDGRPVEAAGWMTEGSGDTVWLWHSRAHAERQGVVGAFVRREGAWQWSPLPQRLANIVGAPRVLFAERGQGGPDVLWMNGVDGMLRVELGRNLVTQGTLPLLFRRLHVPPTKDIDPSSGGPWNFPPLDGRLTAEFASPTYLQGNKVSFRTRLLGYENRWSDWQHDPIVTYTNIEGGPFTLEVEARDVDGRTSLPSQVTFTIAPPWQRSGVAYTLYAVLAFAAMLGVIHWRTASSDRERRRLERIVAERTAELKAAKEQADTANHAKSTFLANMSHELRTPLNGVIGYAQVLMKDPEVSPRNRERLRIVQTSGEHLLRMINEVLDFSKIEAGKMELATTPFHLPQLLRDIAAASSPRFEQKGLEFTFDLSSALPDLVVGDPLKLRQVLDNLLGNAAKFTPSGTVRFSARPVLPDLFEFSVADTGVGISEYDLQQLFTPFHQAADGRPPEPGTGLGLAISQRMVALMGGKLEIESRLGHGSRFFFVVKLPVIAESADARRSTGSLITGYHGPRRKLLVVDDVATNRDVLRELLTPLGFEIHEAPNGEEALRKAAELRPDAIFLDLRMPDIDGLEVAARLRATESGRRLKLFAMSASVLSFSRERAFAAGCDDFLPKPFREDDLLARLGLALQLEWIGNTDAPKRRDSAAPFPPKPSSLDAAVVEELLAITQRGEISQLRAKLATLPADALVEALDSLAKTYRMERIRQLLEEHLAKLRS